MVHNVADREGRLLLVAVDAAAGSVNQVPDWVMPAGFEDVEKADDIAIDVCPRMVDGVAHPRLRSQMDDGLRSDPFKEACERATLAMAGRGRVLLRKSGTEPLVRVMVEGDDETQVRGHAENLAKLVTEVCA